jgi:hypothetical protein
MPSPTHQFISRVGAGDSSLGSGEGRDFALTPDEFKEIRCPKKGGEVIAAMRCISEQEEGCICAKARQAIDACQALADDREVWVRAQPAWKRSLAKRLVPLRTRLK